MTYLITFFVAVSIDWAIPRFMPGDPVQGLISRMHAQPESAEAISGYYTKAFGLDVPLWKQYLNFWVALFHGDLGTSIWQFPRPVSSVILHAVPYTLALLIPAIALSFLAGNKVGALAARRKVLDNTVLPLGYMLTATPYMWLAIVLAYVFGSVLGIFPLSGAYSYALQPELSWEFVSSFLYHWFLPFMSLFLVGFGGWAIGMRNMIIYELESDYSHYLEDARRAAPAGTHATPTATHCCRRSPASRSRSARSWRGALVTEVVFTYPGLGSMILTAIQNRDYFLLQGIFLFIIVGVLVANFIVDVSYVMIDPRTRHRHAGREMTRVGLDLNEPSASVAGTPRGRAGARGAEAVPQARVPLLRASQPQARDRPHPRPADALDRDRRPVAHRRDSARLRRDPERSAVE